MNKLINLLSIGLLLTWHSATFAVEGVYVIELIAFERAGSGNTEAWPEFPEEPDQGKAIASLAEPADTPGNAVRVLPRDKHELGPMSYSLRKSGLQPVLHLAWQQPVHDRNSNDWLWVNTGRIHGLIRLTRGRFLHLDTDLMMQDSQTGRYIPVKLHRKMRSNELHHIDHPRLGLLVQAKKAVDENAAVTSQ